MRTAGNPAAGLALIVGGGLCLGANGYDGSDGLTTYPGTIVTVAAVLVIFCGVLILVQFGRLTLALGAFGGTVLAGYMANQVVLSLYFSHEFRDAVVLAFFGGVLLLFGAALSQLDAMSGDGGATANGTYEPIAPHLQTATAHLQAAAVPTAHQAPVATTAPAGWYADPAGGTGHRYWDGTAWGQTHP